MIDTNNSANRLRSADLLVVVGPSGSGKSTLINLLRTEFPKLFGYSVSHTTRPMRHGEEHGTSYNFVSTEEFQQLADRGEFLEHASVHDTCYGTSKSSVQRVLAEDRVCLMDLDLKGAESLKKNPSLRCIVIFVVAPSFSILESRLRGRGTETEEKIQKRLADGMTWVKWADEHKSYFATYLVNDELMTCYQAFRECVMTSAFKQAVVNSR